MYISRKLRSIFPQRIFQYLAVFTGSINVLSNGMHYGWSSPSLPQLLAKDSHVHITNDQGSWIAVAFLIGCAGGAALSVAAVDKVGRKKVLLMTSFPLLMSWMMLAFARSVTVVLAARTFAGASNGLTLCAIIIYVGEIADPEIRGFLGASVIAIFTVGNLLINVIGSYLNIQDTALVCSASPILQLLAFAWILESPYYLIMKGNLEKARSNLKILKGVDDVEEELNRLARVIYQENSEKGSFLDLFTEKSIRKAVFIVIGAETVKQLSGITAFTFYAQTIFEESADSISPLVATTIFFGLKIAFSGISSAIVDKIGRRPLLITSIIGVSLTLLTEGCYFYFTARAEVNTTNLSLVPIITLMVFVIMYSLGLQTVPGILLSELFPINIKSIAVAFNIVYFCAITTVASKFFQFAKDELGMHVPFFVFGACTILGLLFVVLFVPETKNKTLEEIQEQLKGEPASLKGT